MINNFGRMCPNYCSYEETYSNKNSIKISNAIIDTGLELFNQYLKDLNIKQPEITKSFITAKIEEILPELNEDLKEEDDLFELKSQIIRETFKLYKRKIHFHTTTIQS